MFDKSCLNWDGDDDCNKCAARGYIYDCPENCPDYKGFFPEAPPPVPQASGD